MLPRPSRVDEEVFEDHEDAHRLEISAPIDRLAHPLLRSHVSRCSRRCSGVGKTTTLLSYNLGNAEISDLSPVLSLAFFHEDVRRLDIPMHNRLRLAMCFCRSITHLSYDADHTLDRQRPRTLEDLFERRARTSSMT